MGWTAEQESAINARGCSVLVSAAAGSGKTSVLVERLIRILADSNDRVPADRMAVVTFTKDAAAEMKQRLTAKLAEFTESDPDNQWLNEQQLLLQSAKISTIHSFCFDLIRDNIQELELTGNFRIMDETEASLMTKGVISEVITDCYKTHPEITELLYSQFCTRDDSALEEITGSIYEFICSLPFGISWLERVCRSYSPEGSALQQFTEEYMKHIAALAGRALELSDECVRLAPEGETGDKQMVMLETENDTLGKIRDLFSSPDKTPDEKIREYIKPEFGRLVMAKTTVPEIKERIKSLRDEYRKIINERLESSSALITYAAEDAQMHFRVLSAFLDIIRETDRRLWQKKTEKNCMGFSDAETLAVKLLACEGEDGVPVKSQLARELSEYYRIIMIDEFQDTNNNQDLIFRMLSHGGTAERAGDNLFMVGDVKQSIYRFRLANPKNFIDTMNSSVEYTENNRGENSFIRLNRNFRSSADVISFVNFVFSSVMSREVGEIVYDSGEELVQGAVFSERDRRTEVALIDPDEENAVTQAEYTAEKIYTMLRTGAHVDDRNGNTRACEKRDFCILLRRKGDAADYIRELAKRGIPAYSEETAGYLSSREISVLLSLLRITDNPLTDTSLAAVLLSPLFMFTDDEMIRLRLEKKTGHLYSALCAVADGDCSGEIPDEMREKVLQVMDTVAELRMYAASMSLTELIQYIYDSLDFISLVQMYDDGEKKRANLRALLEYARVYQEASDEGLSGFVRYIDRTLSIKGDFRQGQTVSTSEDVVVIKTIHKSKGLEFPFVFLCESQVGFNNSDSLKQYQFSFEKGIGFRLQNRSEFERFVTLPFEVINRSNRNESVSEEMRLLYVALTRAREKLFITLETGEAQKKKLYEYARSIYQNQRITPGISGGADSMSDWLMMALMTHRNGNFLREFSGYDMFMIQKTEFDIDFVRVTRADTKPFEAAAALSGEMPPDPVVTEAVRNRFAEKYDGDTSGLQAKFSVSDISKDHSSFGAVLKRPSFMHEHSGMTGTEKGTVIHSILQHADFAALAADPEEEIKRAVRNGFITEKQAEQTDVSYLTAFTGSEIFRRAAASPRVEREKKFLVRICDLDTGREEFSRYSGSDSMVQGIIDMYFEEDDGLVLVDYKTDSVSDISVLAENYSLQLALYRAALEITENRKVKETYIYSLKLSKAVKIN